MRLTLAQRLFALKGEYDRSKRQHREREPLAREMSHIMVQILKRENARDRREARDAHS